MSNKNNRNDLGGEQNGVHVDSILAEFKNESAFVDEENTQPPGDLAGGIEVSRLGGEPNNAAGGIHRGNGQDTGSYGVRMGAPDFGWEGESPEHSYYSGTGREFVSEDMPDMHQDAYPSGVMSGDGMPEDMEIYAEGYDDYSAGGYENHQPVNQYDAQEDMGAQDGYVYYDEQGNPYNDETQYVGYYNQQGQEYQQDYPAYGENGYAENGYAGYEQQDAYTEAPYAQENQYYAQPQSDITERYYNNPQYAEQAEYQDDIQGGYYVPQSGYQGEYFVPRKGYSSESRDVYAPPTSDEGYYDPQSGYDDGYYDPQSNVNDGYYGGGQEYGDVYYEPPAEDGYPAAEDGYYESQDMQYNGEYYHSPAEQGEYYEEYSEAPYEQQEDYAEEYTEEPAEPENKPVPKYPKEYLKSAKQKANEEYADEYIDTEDALLSQGFEGEHPDMRQEQQDYSDAHEQFSDESYSDGSYDEQFPDGSYAEQFPETSESFPSGEAYEEDTQELPMPPVEFDGGQDGAGTEYDDYSIGEYSEEGYDDMPEFSLGETAFPDTFSEDDEAGQEPEKSRLSGFFGNVKASISKIMPRKPQDEAEAPDVLENFETDFQAMDLEKMSKPEEIKFSDTYEELKLDPSLFEEGESGVENASGDKAGHKEVYSDDLAPETDEYARLDDDGTYSKFSSGEFDKPKENVIIQGIIAVAAAFVQMNQKRREDAEEQEYAAAMEDTDVPVRQAMRHYTGQIKPLQFRTRVAAGLSLLLLYISFGFPLPGAFKDNIRITSVMCIIILLSVMVTGIDVFTSGVQGFFRRRIGAESLVVFSCLAALADGVYIAVTRTTALGLPYCGAAAFSMTFAIWGAELTCVGYRFSFRNAGISKSPQVVVTKADKKTGDVLLMKARRDTTGFVRRSEEPDLVESTYHVLAPFMIIAILVLSLLASFGQAKFFYLFHIIASLSSVAAVFSALICFPLPFSQLSRRLVPSGAAIAGSAGAWDLSRSNRIVVTDSDLFPPDTLSFDEIRIFEGTYTDKVISYTASVMQEAGCGLTSLFDELVKKNNCVYHRVDEFICHEGGGFVATIRGDQIHVGSQTFMTLMGVRLPKSIADNNIVYTAINGVLVGVFTVKYEPLPTVREALLMLYDSNLKPYFAIKDFNITPLSIKHMFKVPTEGFEFPAFGERFALEGEVQESNNVSAALSRDGLLPVVEASVWGRRLYSVVRLSMIISFIGAFVGIVLMFFLCRTGAFDAARVSNSISYLFIWLVPILFVVFGGQR